MARDTHAVRITTAASSRADDIARRQRRYVFSMAVRNGVERAARTLRHVDWFEVTQVRGHVLDGTVDHFQVGMKVGFRLEDD